MPASASEPQPWPLMVDARTGSPKEPVPMTEVADHIDNVEGATSRIEDTKQLGTMYKVQHPDVIGEAGWGILFASDEDPAVREQLLPLIQHRQAQAPGILFQEFSGTRGVSVGQTAPSWAQQMGVPLNAQVDPYSGVPFYLLIVGSPKRIPFEFQQLVNMQWATGRLYFDDINDYGRYANAVVKYETKANLPRQRKSAAVWAPRNGDLATAMLSGTICQDFLSTNNPLGGWSGFVVSQFVNDQATKANLAQILGGNLSAGPPALIFTGSHGCDYSGTDAATIASLQGALLTKEWVPHTEISDANRFSAADVPADADLTGTIGFFFACYSGGYPAVSSYYKDSTGVSNPIAPEPKLSALPQKLLSKGMLAAIAHVDLAFPYALQNTDGTPQVQVVRTPLELIMQGKPIGLAADSLSVTSSSLAQQISMMPLITPAVKTASPQGSQAPPPPALSSAMAKLIIAWNDARNYITLGDPAVSLRVNDMK